MDPGAIRARARRRLPVAVRAILIVAALAASPAGADEGMWTFDDFPKERVKAAWGFEPSDAWLEHLRLAAVRFNSGASGSFVSPDGLLLTNHHVAADCIAKLSRKGGDLVRAGFLAKIRPEEIACPGLELNVLLAIEDVTEKVNAAGTGPMDDAARLEAPKRALAGLEKTCSEKTGLRCEGVTLYEGKVFALYRYRRYSDVRLVFAPEFAIAFFGGDPENFTFPRYDLDLAFFRAWDAGRPVRPEAWLTVDPVGVAEGDLLFVAGNPGSTDRLLTVAQLELLRDVSYPHTIEAYAELRERLSAFASKGIEEARIAQKDLFRLGSSLKARRGELAGLKDPRLMGAKKADEQALRGRAAALPDAARIAPAWERIAAAEKIWARFYRPYVLLERPLALPGSLFQFARALLRRAQELAKPNEARLTEYRDAALPSLDQRLFSTAPVHPSLEEEKLAWGLLALRRELGAGDPLVEKILAGRSPAQAARALVSGSRLADLALRRALAKGGASAVQRSEDPMLKLARLVDPEARRLRKRYEDEVESVERKNGALIATALFELLGRRRAPDATFTLRLSYGTAKGYAQDGKRVPWATDFGGLYAHANGVPPLALPPRFLEAREQVDPEVPLDFVSTLDIVGGHSGSPVVNRAGALVGLAFDGNMEALSATFLYSEERARAVSVHAAAILEVLDKVYGATALLEELRAPKAP
jgi:hypothetical protein